VAHASIHAVQGYHLQGGVVRGGVAQGISSSALERTPSTNSLEPLGALGANNADTSDASMTKEHANSVIVQHDKGCAALLAQSPSKDSQSRIAGYEPLCGCLRTCCISRCLSALFCCVGGPNL
jgi:hypothetical protein